MNDDLRAYGLAMARRERPVAVPRDGEPLVAYAVDVADDIAVVMIVDRSAQAWTGWFQLWRRLADEWNLASASSSPVDSSDLKERRRFGAPSLTVESTNASLIHSGFWPWSGTYASWQRLAASGDLVTVLVEAHPPRRLEIPWHGHVLVAWNSAQRIERFGPGFGVSAGPSKKAPAIIGLTATGRSVQPESRFRSHP